MEVKKSQHKYVIGPKGNTLQEILEKTGVSVEIPPSDSSSETVILRGEPDRLGQALTEVYAKVCNLLKELKTFDVGYCLRKKKIKVRVSSRRQTATLFPQSQLPLGFIVSLLARRGRTWPRLPNKCPRSVDKLFIF